MRWILALALLAGCAEEPGQAPDDSLRIWVRVERVDSMVYVGFYDSTATLLWVEPLLSDTLQGGAFTYYKTVAGNEKRQILHRAHYGRDIYPGFLTR